jgi:GAF domain-containing protein
VRAGFSVPVLTREDKCLGSLSAHFSEPHAPTDYELKRHALFAQLIALALTRKAPSADQRMSNRGVKRIGDDDRRQASGNN